jgi:UDP-N-acetylglucosamine:LPS N-acetylglucosamine transferase
LILTASVGEGHDLPAQLLAEQIRADRPDVEVRIEDALRSMGWLVRTVSEDAARVVFFRLRWLWDATYWVSAEFAPTRTLTRKFLSRLAATRLLRLVESVDPEVVVSVYPQTTDVLGALRRAGRLKVPAVGAITDIAGLAYWAAPGIDLHLVVFGESVAEVREIAGNETDVRVVRGFSRREFYEPRDAADARRSLGLPHDGRVVLVSGGGWGVGNLADAVGAALRDADVSSVVCLCGRNDALRERLASRFGEEPRVRTEGFTEAMNDWLAAADVLVHSTGGLTVLEAHLRGCPTISFGWGRGHVRRHDQAFAEFGYADVVASATALPAALSRAFAAPKEADLSYAELPSAAELVLALARETEGAERD